MRVSILKQLFWYGAGQSAVAHVLLWFGVDANFRCVFFPPEEVRAVCLRKRSDHL